MGFISAFKGLMLVFKRHIYISSAHRHATNLINTIINYRQPNCSYRSGTATNVTNNYQNWSQSSTKTTLWRKKSRRYQTVTSGFPYVNMSARSQVLHYTQF